MHLLQKCVYHCKQEVMILDTAYECGPDLQATLSEGLALMEAWCHVFGKHPPRRTQIQWIKAMYWGLHQVTHYTILKEPPKRCNTYQLWLGSYC